MIIYQEKDAIFTLHTKNTTYQMQVDSYGFLLHLYYGKRISGNMNYLLVCEDHGFSGNPYDAGSRRDYSMDTLPLEYPMQGNGDYRNSALVIKNGDGTYSVDGRYKSHTIQKGKYNIPGLPALYQNGQEEAETLILCLSDEVTGIDIILRYGVLPEHDIITRSVEIINQGKNSIFIEKISSACLDFVQGEYDFISFYGRHAMERNMQRAPVVHGTYSIGSKRGISSHHYNPFMVLAERGTGEDFGDCYGLSFVYSGNFKGEVEKDQMDLTRVLLGLQDELFSYEVLPQEAFCAPEVVMSYSDKGLAQLSHNYHYTFRNNLCRGKYKTIPRPVLINNWEATYFDFTGAKLYEIAHQAAGLGVEMMVLDDGWFGKREDDNKGLGDWYVNETKMEGSIGVLAEKINGLGMKFGIWIEPEMVSEDSDLYRAHPDWAFSVPGRKPVRSRNQLVLDFSRKEVRNYIFEQICKVLDCGRIEYVKWDMNRSITDVYSQTVGSNRQGAVLHRYVLGVYEFLEKLLSRYPDLLIEGCSGGGGRFDAGMLYYTPQIWCSDNTDAIDRIRIQYGTSFGYPISAVGSHVSAVPNHQTGRETPLKTRGIVAMAGSFGYELDLNKISEEEKEYVRKQIVQYKKYQNLIHNGFYYRLSNPFEQIPVAAWEFVSADKTEALLNITALECHGNQPQSYIRMKGLEEDAEYVLEKTGQSFFGAALMYGGFPILPALKEYEGEQYYFKKK